MSVMLACLCAPHDCRKSIRCPVIEMKDCSEQSPGSLQERWVPLTSEPALQLSIIYKILTESVFTS